ncbi:hypothetical protein ALC57_03161, partial [Trachymyrmex cornetzi]
RELVLFFSLLLPTPDDAYRDDERRRRIRIPVTEYERHKINVVEECTRNETANTCLHTTSVSAEMPERAASSGEDPWGAAKCEGEGERERRLGGEGEESERYGERARGGGEVEPVRSGVCADDCGANSAKRTTTRSRLASSTSNLALFKNEDGAALKSDKFLIGRSRHHPYFSATANESRFYSGARCSATF